MPRSTLPRVLATPLMHATELPPAFHREGWAYEEKYDGYRMLVERIGRRVTLTSRNGLDHTARFPDLVTAIADLGAESVTLDTELAVFDRQLVSPIRVAPIAAEGRRLDATDADGVRSPGTGQPRSAASTTLIYSRETLTDVGGPPLLVGE